MITSARIERCLPLALGFAWWLAFYPGLFGEDSLITLEQARSGDVTVWFTAWWVYVIDALSIGTRVIPLLTLCGVLLLSWSVTEWARSIFPPGRARVWSIALLCATPLVGALGVQVRHDAWMTAGFLLCLSVIARLLAGRQLAARDYLKLILAVLLIPTRHNGLGTLIAAAVIGLAFSPAHRWRFAGTLTGVAAGVFLVTQAATAAAGRSHSIDPVQAVEWMMADVSCLVTESGVEPTADEWRALESIASRSDWHQPVACRFVSPLLIAPTFQAAQVKSNTRALAQTWWSLLIRYPLKMTYVHLRRVNLFLPPFVGGVPEQSYTPFIHSTILPNNFDLHWAFPRAAEIARFPARAWNALRAVLANAAIWLTVLVVVARRRVDLRARLMPTIVICVALELGLLATAPISEGRYGLLILIAGQLTLLNVLFERWLGDPRAIVTHA
ncbi:MAG TPA: hypothetical protein VF491_20325 [Vicinamibacterales bacterium]